MLQIKEILFYVDHCDARSKNTALLIAVKVVFLPANCARQLQLLDLGPAMHTSAILEGNLKGCHHDTWQSAPKCSSCVIYVLFVMHIITEA
jgi:hypothetical protein